jgi:3-oxoacyl-[acyl-carrier protein] reductase
VSGRLVVVTGGRSGLGLACAEAFRALGDDVVTIDISDPDRPVDVGDPAAVEAAFAALSRTPDVLVNAAGVGDGGLILDMSFETWRRTLGVNLDGAFLCLQAAARLMAAAGAGAIVNITSINDEWPMRTAAAYCSAKAGLSMLTRVAALELGRSGVRVNAVAPGVVDTPLVAPAMNIPAVAAEMRARTPLAPRIGRPDEIADVVVFLASAAARWITGEVITVDGGQRLLGEPDVAVLAGAVTVE